MMSQNTKRSTRPSPRSLAFLHIAAGRPATDLFGAEENQHLTGRWRG
jgi:hypothetical protein